MVNPASQRVVYENCSLATLNKEGQRIVRTLDFPYPTNAQYVEFPVGTSFTTNNPKGEPSFSFQSKYFFWGITAYPENNAAPLIVHGGNGKGLLVAALSLAETEYQSVSEDQMGKALQFTLLPVYLLSQCSSFDEVQNVLNEFRVWGDSVWPIGEYKGHLAVINSASDFKVIEYLNGEAHFLDNDLGVMTNDPKLVDQIAQAKELLSKVNTGYAPGSTYPGSGLVPTPGDLCSPSRFQKLAVVRSFIKPLPNQGFQAALQLINTVVVPNGVKDAFPSQEKQQLKEIYDRTHWIVIVDAKVSKVFFRTMNQELFFMIDVKEREKNSQTPISYFISNPIQRDEVTVKKENHYAIDLTSDLNQQDLDNQAKLQSKEAPSILQMLNPYNYFESKKI